MRKIVIGQSYDDWKASQPEEEPIKTCDECKNGIYEGEYYFDFGGYEICDDCLTGMVEYALADNSVDHPVYTCSICSGGIYDGEEYVNYKGDTYCNDCYNDIAVKCEREE